ncbi:hypothetical protein DY000_02048967 [Brassica cretica]|uniref:DUF4005 domain-containing protein n=1 Tax=Brassica cretica TaxID=69181 RepID=A0ABQ7EU02_BRACR|nr:hypothetical protein DY000_02048967 [Brassica cretica]
MLNASSLARSRYQNGERLHELSRGKSIRSHVASTVKGLFRSPSSSPYSKNCGIGSNMLVVDLLESRSHSTREYVKAEDEEHV